MNKEVKKIISDLKKQRISIDDIPDQFKNDWDVIVTERRLGLRTVGRRGYDVISGRFFVEEKIQSTTRDLLDYMLHLGDKVSWFDDFEVYSKYVEGNIYENACYYQYVPITQDESIDYDRLLRRQAFIEQTVDDFTVKPTLDEITAYKEGEVRKTECLELLAQYRACSTPEEIQEIEKQFGKSVLAKGMYQASKDQHADQKLRYEFQICLHHDNFFIWQLVHDAEKNVNSFELLMEYLSMHTCSDGIVREICTFFPPELIVEKYRYEGRSESTKYAQRRRLRRFIKAIQDEEFEKTVRVYFDKATHFYCEECKYKYRYEDVPEELKKKDFFTYRYFESIRELYDYRSGDFTSTDLTDDLNLEFNFERCKIDESTKLPYKEGDQITYDIKKGFLKDQFYVVQRWMDSKGTVIKNHTHIFQYFFDFVGFLKGDLSGADLMLCDGINNLTSFSDLNLQNAKLPSKTRKSLKIDSAEKTYQLSKDDIVSFQETEKNEKRSSRALQKVRGSAELSSFTEFSVLHESSVYLYYISDLHLLHRLQKNGYDSADDIEYVIRKAVQSIVSESPGVVVMDGGKKRRIILIGGDTSSDFNIFCMFVRELKKELSFSDSKNCKSMVIFLLGNHDLWQFSNESFDSITARFREVIEGAGMILLQNDMLCIDSLYEPHLISESQIDSLSEQGLRKETANMRLLIFGGLAFSGYNTEFNADKGIYRNAINREKEIAESIKFETLYGKVCSACYDKNLVVFTHTPMDCWRRTEDYLYGVVYVSGHTHRNVFFDNGKKRIYADNQVGYGAKDIHMKWFKISGSYNTFEDYDDGIHEITSKDYIEFYRGRNKPITFTRDVRTLYMLKKSGYYCFICENQKGTLYILNGGAISKLPVYPIEYFYDNMDAVIQTIKNPLARYSSLQWKVAEEVKRIGGFGTIHGCIVDIDFLNHIYVNPYDSKLTAYWASDMVNKKVYRTIPDLLKIECPKLYSNYRQRIEGPRSGIEYLSADGESETKDENNLTVPAEEYLKTDIYKASREVCKMQKIYDNILTTWVEDRKLPKNGKIRDNNRSRLRIEKQ